MEGGESSEWLGYDRLVEELGASEERVLSLEAENVELRASLRKSISGSALGREFEVLSVDREKLARLIEQLKVEKTHLVESVLLLSTEVDEANRLRQDDQLKFKQEVLRHAENERAVRAGKYRMGMQVVELLRIRGLDNSIRQDVNAYVANSCASSMNFGMPGYGEKDVNASPESPLSHSGDEGESRWEQTTSPTNNSVGRSSNSARDRDGRKRRHFRRRRSEVLARDETDSIISSVSTHRSGATSKNGGSNKYLGGKKSHTPITAETLAMLDKQNSSGGRNMSPAKQEPEVQGPNWWGF